MSGTAPAFGAPGKFVGMALPALKQRGATARDLVPDEGCEHGAHERRGRDRDRRPIGPRQCRSCAWTLRATLSSWIRNDSGLPNRVVPSPMLPAGTARATCRPMTTAPMAVTGRFDLAGGDAAIAAGNADLTPVGMP